MSFTITLKDLGLRYLVSIAIGLIFYILYGLSGGPVFMNHFSMLGVLMMDILALFLFVEIPLWMILAYFLCRVMQNLAAEVLSASIVALLFAQVFYYPMLSEENLSYIATKEYMVLWYIATTTNWLLGLLTSVLYLIIRSRRTC